MPLRFKLLSIRSALSLLVSAMGVLMLSSGAVQIFNVLSEKEQAKQVEVIAKASQTLFRSFVGTRLERGTLISSTLSERAATAAQASRIAVNRAISERAYQDIVAQLPAIDMPGLAAARARLIQTHAAMQVMRTRVDADIGKPKSERDPALADDAPRISGEYVAAIVAMSDLLESTIANKDAMVEYFLGIKQAAWAMRNYGGLIAVRIEQAAAVGRQWSAEDVAAANRDAGRIDYAWDQVTAAARHPGMPASLLDLIDKNRGYFVGPMADERAQLIHTLLSGGKIKLSMTDLQQRDTAELAPMIDIANGALEVMVAGSEGELERTDRVLLLSSLQGVVALLLTITGFSFVYFRISLPLSQMTLAMKRLTDRRQEMASHEMGADILPVLQFTIPYVEREDEIGDTARSLEILRMSLVEQQELALRESESNEQLRRAEKELVEAAKLAALGRLVAGIAHEINTPIGSALMVATTVDAQEQAFRAKFEGAQGRMQRSDLEAFLETVRTAAQIQVQALSSAASLIRSFKQVAVDQAGEQKRNFLLGELVAQVISTLRPTFKHLPHRIVSTIDEAIEMDSYPGPLGQVISNLIANGVIHGLGDERLGTVMVAAVHTGEAVRITVTDDGAGIDAAHLPHIFEPFFTTKLAQGGTGLGLHIVHSIVTSVLCGTIEVVTQEGQGTTFTLNLPCRLTLPETP